MAQSMEIASFRRITPGILASARLAMANDIPETSKAEVAIILKKAAPILGIDGSTYHIMDILIGLSRADDWKGANRPIVAISNAKLAEYTCRSERQVTRCIRRLVEAGIVAYRDSPTGRRFVYRGKDGDISKGYGLDFTPARVRINELKALVNEFQARLNSEQEARRAVTRLSRAIVDACEAYPEHAVRWSEELERVKGLGLDLEEEAKAEVNAAYLMNGWATLDTTTDIEHLAEKTYSSQLIKGVVGGEAKGVFQGKIRIAPNAQKTEGRQLHKALLLSDTAEIDVKPELEIYADDVKCSHGAASGELDQEQLFYLRSRGIGEEEARQMLIDAYLTDVVARVDDPEIRDWLRGQI